MFLPLVIHTKPDTKRRDFVAGKWVDVPAEAVYVVHIEAKEPKQMNCRNRKARLVVEASVRNNMELARICIRVGQPEGAHKYLSQARFALKVMSQHTHKLERLP